MSSPPLLLGIEHIQLNIPTSPQTLPSTVSRVRHFYTTILRLTEIPCSPTIRPPSSNSTHLAILWFAFPNNPTQHIHIVLKSDAQPRVDSDPEKEGKSSRAHPGLIVRDLDALKELRGRLEGEGCEVKEIKNFEKTEGGEARGRWRFEGRDFWGNNLEFLSFQ